MFIRVVSDLHLEFNPTWILPSMPEDNETILILAGDVGLASKSYTFVPFIEDVSERFQDVIFIMGNHEHYKGNFPTSFNKIKDAVVNQLNVHVLEKESIVIDDVAFICASLWTDMNNHNVLCIEQSRNAMNDYKIIRTGPTYEPWKKRLHPHDTIADFINAKCFIFEEVKKQMADNKTVVVVTHHLPSYKSIPPQFVGDTMNGAYASELSEDILDNPYKLHIHGHTHDSVDYMIGDTRIVCNPLGYMTGRGSDLNQNFDPLFRIKL